jgi:predicted phosphodiesterase
MQAKLGAAGAVCLLLILASVTGPRAAADRGLAEDFLFAFAVIADSHINGLTSDDYRYIKAMTISRQILANMVGDINRHTPPVDFVVHLGDITESGTEREFNWTAAIMDSLSCPLYPVVGNHDNFQSDHKQNWKDFAGMDSTNYFFDYFGIHFLVIDCTLQPYIPPFVHCDALVRSRVAAQLAMKPDMPAVLLTHYNMWERPWNAAFDTTKSYQEYMGVPWLRDILEDAGNVVAVINGHVHANRVEVHEGIHYIDVNATLVGRPSIRYFYVYENRIEVDYAYISDEALFEHVESLGPMCIYCFDPDSVCAYADGAESDKKFTIYYEGPRAGVDPLPPVDFEVEITRDAGGLTVCEVASAHTGMLDLALYDVTGRRIARSRIYKDSERISIDLGEALPHIREISGGIYFISVGLGGTTSTRKLPLVR